MTQQNLWPEVIQPAIDQADNNAAEVWKETAEHCLRSVAESMHEFTADDVTEAIERVLDPEQMTHEPSALGPVFLRASKSGLIRNTNRVVQSRIPRRHRKITVWQSLIVKVDQ